MTQLPLRTLGAMLIAVTVIGLLLAYYHSSSVHKTDTLPTAKNDNRVSEKLGGILKLKSPLVAESYGIMAEPATEVQWHPRMIVDGRVVANPHALLEVRAPFAGILGAGADRSSFYLGTPVKAQEVLGVFEGRFNLVEKLDVKSKRIEAEARYQNAEEVLKIRQERSVRMEDLKSSGSISRGDIDAAAVQLFEARMLKDLALAQKHLWSQSLASTDKNSISVPILAPIDGEISEIGAQPGTSLEAGQLIVRIVDFRHVLIRLDFPSNDAEAGPPGEIDVEAVSMPSASPVRWKAHLRGTSASVEVGLQKTGYLYEILPRDRTPPKWRPGMYVKASLPDPGKAQQPAVAIPASALLFHQGRTLVYIELNVGRYERREVFVLDRDADRYYVSPKGWTSTSDAVVTRHAQTLLSEEFRSDVDDD